MNASIRIGIGGWTYEPWRNGNFYPKGWPAARELEYASRRLTTIEVNGTFYRLQSPSTFAKWRDETPEGFVFAIKAHRFVTHRRVLAEAGEGVQRFAASGLAELGPKLGPILWQLPPTLRFDAQDVDAFLNLLPGSVGGVELRHALDVRHESFRCAEYIGLARRHRVATVFTDSRDYPSFADITGPFVYVREMRTDASLPLGCTPAALSAIAACARSWRNGAEPGGLPRIGPTLPDTGPRDVFVLFISGAKEKAPAAAMAVIDSLSR